MTDLSRLQQALDYEAGELIDLPEGMDTTATILAAARSLLAGQDIQWCEVHGDRAYVSPSACHTGVDTGDYGDCHIVPARLILDNP